MYRLNKSRYKTKDIKHLVIFFSDATVLNDIRAALNLADTSQSQQSRTSPSRCSETPDSRCETPASRCETPASHCETPMEEAEESDCGIIEFHQ